MSKFASAGIRSGGMGMGNIGGAFGKKKANGAVMTANQAKMTLLKDSEEVRHLKHQMSKLKDEHRASNDHTHGPGHRDSSNDFHRVGTNISVTQLNGGHGGDGYHRNVTHTKAGITLAQRRKSLLAPQLAVRTFNNQQAPKEEEKVPSKKSSSSRGPESESIMFEENSDIDAELEKLDKKDKQKMAKKKDAPRLSNEKKKQQDNRRASRSPSPMTKGDAHQNNHNMRPSIKIDPNKKISNTVVAPHPHKDRDTTPPKKNHQHKKSANSGNQRILFNVDESQGSSTSRSIKHPKDFNRTSTISDSPLNMDLKVKPKQNPKEDKGTVTSKKNTTRGRDKKKKKKPSKRSLSDSNLPSNSERVDLTQKDSSSEEHSGDSDSDSDSDHDDPNTKTDRTSHLSTREGKRAEKTKADAKKKEKRKSHNKDDKRRSQMMSIKSGTVNEDEEEQSTSEKQKRKSKSHHHKKKKEDSTKPQTAADQERFIEEEEEEALFDDQMDYEEDNQYFVGLEDLQNFHLMNEVTNATVHDVRVQNEWYNRIKVVEYTQVFLSCFGIALSIVRNELRDTLEISLENEYLVLCYDMAISFLICLALYFRYEIYLHWYCARGLLTEFDTLYSTGWWKNMVVEQAINLISPYPFFQGIKYYEVNTNWHVTISYEINQILMCVTFFRLYIVLRFFLVLSKFMNQRSNRVCTMNGCEANHMFAIKSIMKQNPFFFLTVTLIINIYLFGYQLKVFEGPLSEVSNQNFTLISNACWNVIITLTTTGYGELYPKSLLGRFMGLVICFWGTFMVSFFVVTVNNMLTFTPSEEKSFNLLLRLHFKEELKEYAVSVLSSAYKHRLARLKNDEQSRRVISAMRKFRGNMLSFQQAVLRVRNYYEGDSEIDIIMRLVDLLREDIEQMKVDQEAVRDSLTTVVSFIERIDQKMLFDQNQNNNAITEDGEDEYDDEEEDEDEEGSGKSKSKATSKNSNVIEEEDDSKEDSN